LCACGAAQAPAAPSAAPEPTASPEPVNAGVEELALTADAVQDLSVIADYPDLKLLDLRGSSLPLSDLAAWAGSHPELELRFDLGPGGPELDSRTQELELEAGFDPDALAQALPLLTSLQKLDLPETDLSPEALDLLAEAAPGVALDYSVRLPEGVFPRDTQSLDLSDLDVDALEAQMPRLALLPELKSVTLMDGDGDGAPTPEQVSRLMELLPDAEIAYRFPLFGQMLSTQDARVEFEDVPIGNDGVPALRDALSILPSCEYFLLDGCGIDNELCAQLRDEFPDAHVVWRVYADMFNMLTDETMVRMTFTLNDENAQVLQYCTEVTYMDIGHNTALNDISFIASMTKLECVIVSGAPVRDVSVFANCPNIEWLELCFCGNVKDLSALSGLENLRFLNVSFSQVADISPIENLALERFNCMGCKVSATDQAAYKAAHPDCIAIFEGKQPYGYGWRYDDNGYHYFSYYAHMREVFRYDEHYYGNHKEA
jgi:Leucine-rich repeat (LRR) protein